MIKLFASDLDGTLLNLTHTADKTIRDAVAQVTAAGLHVVAATGRLSVPQGQEGFSGLQVEGCCANGSIIRDASGKVLKTYPLDPDIVREVLKEFPQVCWDFSSPDGMLISGSYEEHEASFKNEDFVHRVLLRGMRARGGFREDEFYNQTVDQILSHEICKINAHGPEGALADEINAFVAEHSDHIINAPFNPVMFEITDKDCNKGVSVAWLANYLGIEEDECAVYGDGGNDIAMLRRFKHSYATSGASGAAKAAASQTIGSCVLHAVPRHMLKTLHSQRA